MIQQYTGIKFFTEVLGVQQDQILGAFSFYSDYQNNNIVYPDSWATESYNGILSIKSGNNQNVNFLKTKQFTGQSIGQKILTSDNGKIIITNDGGVLTDGFVHIYKEKTPNQWILDQKLENPTVPPDFYPFFGADAAISKDGKIIMVSSYDGVGEGENGNVFIYTGNLNSKYVLRQRINFDAPLSPPSSVPDMNFYIIDNNNTLIIGNSMYSPVINNIMQTGVGGIFIYTGSINNGWGLSSKIIGTGIEGYLNEGGFVINENATALLTLSKSFVPPNSLFLNHDLYTGSPIAASSYKKIFTFTKNIFASDTGIFAPRLIDDKLIFWRRDVANNTSGNIMIYSGIFNTFQLEKQIPTNLNGLIAPFSDIFYIQNDLSFYNKNSNFITKYNFNSLNNQYSQDNSVNITGDLFTYNSDQSKFVTTTPILTFNVYEYTDQNVKKFFQYTGTGYFDGNTILTLDENLPTTDISIFLSYEKLRHGEEILLSSLTGVGNNLSGFYLGINDANKLYFKYVNPVEGVFTFTYKNILANKNLIYLNYTNSNISLGRYNNNTFSFEIENYNLLNNSFRNSNILNIGGTGGYNNFSGYIDKFFVFKNLPTFYKEEIASGLFSNPTAVTTSSEEFCSITGYYTTSGFIITGVTGTAITNFVSGIGTGVTGYQTLLTGFSYSGITGYQQIYLGSYVDNCGISNDIIQNVALSGLITGEYNITIPLTGFLYVTGSTEIILTGVIQSGEVPVAITGELCVQGTGIGQVNVSGLDLNYLSSLSFSEISSLIEYTENKNISGNIVEIFTKDYKPETLPYNENLLYDFLNRNYFKTNKELDAKQIMLYGNGQLLINSGYNTIQSGYDILDIPKLDYFITGSNVNLQNDFIANDYLFYDNISGVFHAFKTVNTINSGSKIVDLDNNSTGEFIFLNGQKLIQSIDFVKSGFSIYANRNISGENYFVIKYYSDNFNSYINNNTYTNKWLFKQKFSGDNSIDNFGSSVVSNDNANIIVIGELNDANVGSASIFTGNSNVGWEFKQKITGSGAGSNFGYSLASSKNGNIIIMGGPEYDPLPASQYLNAGGVAIFTGSFNTNWVLKQIITGDTIGTVSNQNDKFGHSVATNNDGSIIIVGVPSDNIRDLSLWPSTINDIGSAMIFTGNAVNGWNFRQKITGDFNSSSFFNFGYGYCVVTNNDSSIIAMSGPIYSAFGNVAIFTGNAINGWNLKQIVSGNRAGGGFGESMAMNNNGNILVVGQPSFDVFSDPQIGNPGSILIFTGNAINGWKLKQDITGDWASSTQGDLFGKSLSINENGSIITVAAPLEDSLGPGSINIFSGNINDGWKSIQKIYNISSYSLTNNNDGDIIIAGSQYDMINNITQAGSASIYKLSSNTMSGTLKINSYFNHGCSQLYLNGIRQKINNNYIENSDFDMISGLLFGHNNKNIIYNNTDDFIIYSN